MALSFYSRKKIEPQQSMFQTNWGQYQSGPTAQQSGVPQTPKGIVQSSMRLPGKTQVPAYQSPQQKVQALISKIPAAPTRSNQVTQKVPTPPAATPPSGTPPPANQQAAPSGYDSILQRMRGLARERILEDQTGRDEAKKQLESLEAERQARKQQQISSLEGYKQRAVDRIMAGIPEAEALTAEQKAGIQQRYGEEAKSDIQRQREEEARLQQTFAGLGTLDSSVFQTAAAKQAQAATERGAARTRSMNAEIAQADRDLVQAKRAAEAQVDEEVFNFEYAARTIEENYAPGTQAYYKAMNDLVNGTQERIYALQQGVLDAEMGVENLRAKSLSEKTGKNLTDKQMSFMSAAQIAQNALQKLNAGGVSTGFGQGILGQLGERFGWNTAQQQSYRSDIAAARTAVRNALLGASMSPQEMESLMAAIPEYSDAPEVARQKLQSFILNTQIMAQPGQQTTPVVMSQPDEVNKLLNAGFTQQEILEYLGS